MARAHVARMIKRKSDCLVILNADVGTMAVIAWQATAV